MLIWISLGCDVDHSVDKALHCSGSEQELDLVLKVFGHKKAPLMAGQRVGGCQLRDESDDWRSLVAEVVGPDLIVHSGI